MADKVVVRQRHIDCVAGVLIIHMMCSHAFQMSECIDSIYYLISSLVFYFFMPWFFFKSGMFHRTKTIKQIFVSGGGGKLLLPYVFYLLIGQILMMIILSIEGSFSVRTILLSFVDCCYAGSCSGNTPLWFLLSLFVVKMLFSIVESNKYLLYIMFVSFLLVAIWAQSIGLQKPLWVGNIATGFIFYCAGYNLGNIYKHLLFYIAGIIAVANIVFFKSIVDMRANELISGWYGAWIVSSIAACIAVNWIFNKLTRPFLFGIDSLLERIGNNSMAFYVTHWLFLQAGTLLLLLTEMHMSPFQLLVYYLVCIWLGCVIVMKTPYLPYVKKQ